MPDFFEAEHGLATLNIGGMGGCCLNNSRPATWHGLQFRSTVTVYITNTHAHAVLMGSSLVGALSAQPLVTPWLLLGRSVKLVTLHETDPKTCTRFA